MAKTVRIRLFGTRRLSFAIRRSFGERLLLPSGSAEKLIAQAKNWPQALKRQPISNGLAARVELVPFPKSTGREFSRSLLAGQLAEGSERGAQPLKPDAYRLGGSTEANAKVLRPLEKISRHYAGLKLLAQQGDEIIGAPRF
jgi:hypothetical protein